MGTSLSRALAIDYGTKRVGVAISDPLRIVARPYGTFPPDQVLKEIEALHQKMPMDRIVVGWPLDLDGAESAMTKVVSKFIEKLSSAFPDVEIIKWDERYTSEIARQKMIESGARRKARRDKSRLDSAAAAIMLQEYLDSQSNQVS